MEFSFPGGARGSATFAGHRLSLLILASIPGPSWSQAALSGVTTLPKVAVTGNPSASSDLIAPAAAYAGTALLLRSKSTLAETQDGTPGIGSTYFGPNATCKQKVGTSDLLWFARRGNIADRLAYSASSMLTQTVPGKASLPGSSLKVGLQAFF